MEDEIALLSCDVAVIVAVPVALPVTTPLALTVATLVLFDDHATFRFVAFAGLTLTSSWRVAPASKLKLPPIIDTDVTGIPVDATVTVVDVTPAFTGSQVDPRSRETLILYVRAAAWEAPNVSVAVPPVALAPEPRATPLVPPIVGLLVLFPGANAPTLTSPWTMFVPVTVITEFLLVALAAIVAGFAVTAVTGVPVAATVTVVVGEFRKVAPPSLEILMVY